MRHAAFDLTQAFISATHQPSLPKRASYGLLSHYPQWDSARFIEPDEVACFILFLLTRAAMPITGAVLGMDFGVTAGD